MMMVVGIVGDRTGSRPRSRTARPRMRQLGMIAQDTRGGLSPRRLGLGAADLGGSQGINVEIEPATETGCQRRAWCVALASRLSDRAGGSGRTGLKVT